MTYKTTDEIIHQSNALTPEEQEEVLKDLTKILSKIDTSTREGRWEYWHKYKEAFLHKALKKVMKKIEEEDIKNGRETFADKMKKAFTKDELYTEDD